MKQFTITVPVTELTYGELTHAQAALCRAAIEATARAYAPYSRFDVGAAIRLEGGETVTGSNQENAAYPSGTCAERTACYYAHSRWPHARFEAVAIAARHHGGDLTDDPIPPCGACRQALLEYETLAGRDVPVMLAGRSKVYLVPSVRALLPLAFSEF